MSVLCAEAASSIARVEKYLLEASSLDEKAHDKTSRGVDIRNAVFQYDGHGGEAFKLNVPEFKVAPGEVVGVVGRVGAGKTALLQALMGHMPCRSGHFHVGGQIAYVPQTAWIQNLSIRENILFGKYVLATSATWNMFLLVCCVRRYLPCVNVACVLNAYFRSHRHSALIVPNTAVCPRLRSTAWESVR